MKDKKRHSTIFGVIMFFLLVASIVTISMLIYGYANEKSNGDNRIVAVVMLFTVVFLAIICTVSDVIRRKIMVEQPVEKILSATERITNGDFAVKLDIRHAYGKYDEYDVIMENLNLMAEELSKNQVLKDDFISNVSHELKTPLAVIQNYSALIKKGNLSEQDVQNYAGVLVETSKKLSSLVTDILKLNKLDNSKITEKEKVYLHDLIAETVINFESEIENKNLNVDCDLKEVEITSVKSYLEIILNNLVSNAIKFTNENGNISITLRREVQGAVITVKDDGVGMTPETGKRIFEKFYQGDTSHSGRGNGLGLALVKRVIEILGGEISVQSELNKGSTFTVMLKGI